MLRALVVVVVAVMGACAVDAEPRTSLLAADDNDVAAACRLDALQGCLSAGDACTWCSPAGSSCTNAFTPFCDGGLAWCSDKVCRPFCAVIAFPRCPTGTGEHHEKSGTADVCVCVPG